MLLSALVSHRRDALEPERSQSFTVRQQTAHEQRFTRSHLGNTFMVEFRVATTVAVGLGRHRFVAGTKFGEVRHVELDGFVIAGVVVGGRFGAGFVGYVVDRVDLE